MRLPQLPIHAAIPELHTALEAGSAVLAAPPGSGKTTIVPLTLLNAPWLQGKKILMLEPRRLATRAAAARMASLLGEKVGQTIGYQVRFDRRVSTATRVEVVTEGILTRRIQEDSALQDIGLIIFDEFHERSLHADLALALCLDLRQLREDLRLLVMSATLDTRPIAELLGGVPIITAKGRSHPVSIAYLERKQTGDLVTTVTTGIQKVCKEHTGDVLVFLPGTGEIRAVGERLAQHPALEACSIVPLHGNLPLADQDRALTTAPDGRRRIILATSIAETSLTIEGIHCVVDSGWSRRPQFHPASGLTRLTTVRVSRAVADQRAGRAGRTSPGACLRLWAGEEQYNLPPFHPPEIREADLAQFALELALWGVADPVQLQWLSPPPEGAFQQARTLLEQLGALDRGGRITPAGKQMATLAMHPRLGNMVLQGKRIGHAALACDLAALLSERDIVRTRSGPKDADILSRLALLEEWRKKKSTGLKNRGADPRACSRVDTIARAWLKRIGAPIDKGGKAAVGTLLAYAYPDRIAHRRSQEQGTFLLASGRAARLSPLDPLAANEFLLACRLDAGCRQGKIFLAAPVQLATLLASHPHLFSQSTVVEWDTQRARVIAVDRQSLGAIVVEEHPATSVAPALITQALLTGIRQQGLNCLPWDRPARQLQLRVNSLRQWQPQAGWPDISDNRLERDLSWLEPHVLGINTVEKLRQLNLAEILSSQLDWKKQQLLEQLAPSTITVPSGSRIRLRYQEGEPPILAVRLQEMFGLAATPTVCGGKVPVLLHLLSPAQRPIQVTSDLAGFWQRSYPEVKKELKGRYPKHWWPEDPLTAAPTRGTKKSIMKNRG